jgi:hypothetical protein
MMFTNGWERKGAFRIECSVSNRNLDPACVDCERTTRKHTTMLQSCVLPNIAGKLPRNGDAILSLLHNIQLGMFYSTLQSGCAAT